MKLNKEALKALRERSGFSKTQFAERSGIDRTIIGRLETGERKGTDEQIVAAARALNVPVVAITHSDDDEAAA